MTLKKYLKNNQRSLRWLSKKTGISYSTLYDLYSGKKKIENCRINLLVKISNAIECSLSDTYYIINDPAYENATSNISNYNIEKSLVHYNNIINYFSKNVEYVISHKKTDTFTVTDLISLQNHFNENEMDLDTCYEILEFYNKEIKNISYNAKSQNTVQSLNNDYKSLLNIIYDDYNKHKSSAFFNSSKEIAKYWKLSKEELEKELEKKSIRIKRNTLKSQLIKELIFKGFPQIEVSTLVNFAKSYSEYNISLDDSFEIWFSDFPNFYNKQIKLEKKQSTCYSKSKTKNSKNDPNQLTIYNLKTK